jgi:hypothetical protein
MTVTVKAMDTQRWICRIHLFQFNGTSSEDESEAVWANSAASWEPREQVDELPAHHLPFRWGSFVHFLQQSFEAIESVAPEDGIVFDPIDQGGQSFPISSVVGLASFRSSAGAARRAES